MIDSTRWRINPYGSIVESNQWQHTRPDNSFLTSYKCLDSEKCHSSIISRSHVIKKMIWECTQIHYPHLLKYGSDFHHVFKPLNHCTYSWTLVQHCIASFMFSQFHSFLKRSVPVLPMFLVNQSKFFKYVCCDSEPTSHLWLRRLFDIF